MQLEISCPACGRKIDCDEALKATFDCPTCGHLFNAVPVSDLPPPIVPPSPNVNAAGVPGHPSPVPLRTQHGGLNARKPVPRLWIWMLILVCLLALAGIKLKNYWEVCSEQQKRKKQGEIQQQEPARKVQEEILQQEPARKEPNIIQEQARKERDNQQKLIQKQQAILLAVERITKETDQWDRFISTATPNKPFINSIGIPFARVSGTRFLVSLKLISKTELAKAHDPSINDISSDENTWKEAVEFCTWLSYVETQNYHLPSNAEWEAIIKSGILEDNKESWIWSSETASLRDAFCSVGDVKVLRGYSFKYINRKETPDDVVIHCILAPKM